MTEKYEQGAFASEQEFPAETFTGHEGEAKALAKTSAFFDHVKQTVGLSHLAQKAAEWHEDVIIMPLGRPGKKPVRTIHMLDYYDIQTVAMAVSDHLPDGTIAVSWFRNETLSPEFKAALQGIATLEEIIDSAL